MDKQATGTELVARMAGERQWWKLRASDVNPWLKTLHSSAREHRISGIGWIGEPWNGQSDVAVGCEMVRGEYLVRLLRELSRELRARKLPNVRIPDGNSIRQCLVGRAQHASLTIDFDCGDFILPISIGDRVLADEHKASVPPIAASMVSIIERAEKQHDNLAQRETRMREAVEISAAKLGCGVAPLWLRMEPLPIFQEPRHLTRRRYNFLLVILDDCLMWSPVDAESVEGMKDIRRLHSIYGQQQRLRAAKLADLEASGSEGCISEVALAMINERGLDPRAVFEQARQSRLDDLRGVLEFDRNGSREMVYYREGAVKAMFLFPGGAYADGELMIHAQFPETVVSGAKGQLLSKFVDHPVLCATGVKVRRAQNRLGSLELSHTVRMISLEEVERRVALAA